MLKSPQDSKITYQFNDKYYSFPRHLINVLKTGIPPINLGDNDKDTIRAHRLVSDLCSNVSEQEALCTLTKRMDLWAWMQDQERKNASDATVFHNTSSMPSVDA